MDTTDMFAEETPHGGGVRIPELPDADIEYLEHFLNPDQARAWFAALMQPGAVSWRQDHLTMYGRRIAVPRLNAWYGDAGLDYTYSGIHMQSEPWTDTLQEIRFRVEGELRWHFTSVLINLYRDGRDSVAWHADDEPELGDAPVIASLSLGAAREFHLRHRDYRANGLPVFRLRLAPGSLLVMRGQTQKNWLHQVPKRLGRHSPGPRINLTFRRIMA